jgi:hypothetical protein
MSAMLPSMAPAFLMYCFSLTVSANPTRSSRSPGSNEHSCPSCPICPNSPNTCSTFPNPLSRSKLKMRILRILGLLVLVLGDVAPEQAPFFHADVPNLNSEHIVAGGAILELVFIYALCLFDNVRQIQFPRVRALPMVYQLEMSLSLAITLLQVIISSLFWCLQFVLKTGFPQTLCMLNHMQS